MRKEGNFRAHENLAPCGRRFYDEASERKRRAKSPVSAAGLKSRAIRSRPCRPIARRSSGCVSIQRMASESAFASWAGAKRPVCPGRMRSRLPGISLTMVGSESDIASYKRLGLPTLLALRRGGLRAGRPNHILPERQESRSKRRTKAETPGAWPRPRGHPSQRGSYLAGSGQPPSPSPRHNRSGG